MRPLVKKEEAENLVIYSTEFWNKEGIKTQAQIVAEKKEKNHDMEI